MPKTSAERQEILRKKRHKEGLIRIELWINPKWKEKILAFISDL